MLALYGLGSVGAFTKIMRKFGELGKGESIPFVLEIESEEIGFGIKYA